jgi:hypothetical protein
VIRSRLIRHLAANPGSHKIHNSRALVPSLLLMNGARLASAGRCLPATLLPVAGTRSPFGSHLDECGCRQHSPGMVVGAQPTNSVASRASGSQSESCKCGWWARLSSAIHRGDSAASTQPIG